MHAHRHPFHEIIVVLSGRMKVCIRDETITAAAGDVLFYHAGLSHEEWSDREHPVRTIFIDFRSAESLDWLPSRTADMGGRIRNLALWMLKDRLLNKASGHVWLLALLEELRRLTTVDSVPWLDAVRVHMHQHLQEPLDLNRLARVGEMSRFAFVRKYKKITGMTPMVDLRQMRIEQARTLLLTSAATLKEIASDVGISDEFQLSKLFRKHFGLSPREIRNYSVEPRR